LNAKYKDNSGKRPSERLECKDHLLGFLKNRAGRSASGIGYSKADGCHLTGPTSPVQDFPQCAFMACFSGRGLPQMLAGMIQLISYWRSHRRPREGVSVGPVSEIPDKCLRQLPC
jgi:hypothetical protein